jgi:hypothetical protein
MKIALAACGLCLALVACADVPEKSAAVAQAYGDAHVTVRAEGGRLWWSHHPWTEPHALWKLPASGTVEALSVRAVASDTADDVFVVTFQQGGRSFRGTFGFDAASQIEAPSAYLGDHDVGALALETNLVHAGR